MKWSQLKQRVEEHFADSVKGRVELRTTRYHKAHDQMGRAWITFDDREVIGMCSFAAEVAHYGEETRLRQASGCTDYCNPEHKVGYRLAYDQAEVILKERAVFSQPEFHRSLFDYLNLSIDRMLSSPDPMIRAVGMLDRRVGNRRLLAMDAAGENPMVAQMFTVRCAAEHARSATRSEQTGRLVTDRG